MLVLLYGYENITLSGKKKKFLYTQTIFEFTNRLVAGSDSAFVVAVQQESCSSAEIQISTCLKNCLASPRRIYEAYSAAPWQRAPPLDHVQVAAVRAAWQES